MYIVIESSVIHNQRYVVQVRYKGKIILKYEPLKGKTPTVEELESRLKELGATSNLPVVLKEYEKTVNLVALQYSNDGYY